MNLFKTITIRTPESVELEFTLAGIGNRALALLIDYLLVALLISLGSIIASFLSEQLVALWAQIGGGTDVPIVHTVELLDWATGGPQPPALTAPGKRELAVPILR